MKTIRESTDMYGPPPPVIPYVGSALWPDTIFLDVINGDDLNDGKSPGTALKTPGLFVTRLTDGYNGFIMSPISVAIDAGAKIFLNVRFYALSWGIQVNWINATFENCSFFGSGEWIFSDSITELKNCFCNCDYLHFKNGPKISGQNSDFCAREILFSKVLSAYSATISSLSANFFAYRRIKIEGSIDTAGTGLSTTFNALDIIEANEGNVVFNMNSNSILELETNRLYINGYISAGSKDNCRISLNVNYIDCDAAYNGTPFLKITPTIDNSCTLLGYIGRIYQSRFIERGAVIVDSRLNLFRGLTRFVLGNSLTFSGVTAETNLFSFGVNGGAANQPGKGFKIRATGKYSGQNVGSISFRIRHNSTLFRLVQIPLNMIYPSNQDFVLDAEFLPKTSGAAAAVGGSIQLAYNTAPGGNALLVQSLISTVNLNLVNYFDLRLTVQLDDANQAITVNSIVVTEIGGNVI